MYEKVVAELRRVMLCGETSVEQCKAENWRRSLINSADSASMGKRLLLHLNEFRLYIEILRLVAESAVAPDGIFIGPDILDLSTADVNDVSQSDIERLRSTVRRYKTTSYPQGDVTRLAEYVLEKLRATNSDHGHQHLIEYDDVNLGDFLGKGSSGAVFKCEFLGEKAAAKVFTASRPTEVDIIEKEACGSWPRDA